MEEGEMGLKMFFSNLLKVYSLYWASIPDTRKRWNWLIFSGLIIGSTLGIIAAIIFQVFRIVDYNIPGRVFPEPSEILLKAISVLTLGLILMCLLHDRPKS